MLYLDHNHNHNRNRKRNRHRNLNRNRNRNRNRNHNHNHFIYFAKSVKIHTLRNQIKNSKTSGVLIDRFHVTSPLSKIQN